MLGYGIAGMRESNPRLLHLPFWDKILQSGLYLSTQHSECFSSRNYKSFTKTETISAFYPTYISVVNLLQSLHFGGTLNHKKRRFFWIAVCCLVSFYGPLRLPSSVVRRYFPLGMVNTNLHMKHPHTFWPQFFKDSSISLPSSYGYLRCLSYW